MTSSEHDPLITVGVLALQGAFDEHIQLLRQASTVLSSHSQLHAWKFFEVRNASELDLCDALIIPGGESTTISLVAQRSGLLEPLRDFVKVKRKPTWGTCAGLILLAESANRTKKGGQELIGGLDVRVNRNHFGRQTESFKADLDLAFLRRSNQNDKEEEKPFNAVFIRAPIVEKILTSTSGVQKIEAQGEHTVVAPSKGVGKGLEGNFESGEVEIMAILPWRAPALWDDQKAEKILDAETGDIVAVRQGNCFGTSFHPELSGDERVHIWWLEQLSKSVGRRDR